MEYLQLERDSEKFRRGEFNYGDAPIGENIFKIIESKLKLDLLKRPINGDNPGAFIRKVDDNITVFINSNLYLDKQIFAAAHELYHYFYDIKSDSSNNKAVVSPKITQDEELLEDINEKKANYFAAVFLLPSSALAERVEKYSHHTKIDKLLFDIIHLQVEFEVPYKTVVKRLRELKYIGSSQYEELMNIPPRDENGPVYNLAKQIGESFFNSFKRLNTRNREIYFTDAPFIKAVDNYNHDRISYNKLLSILELYNRKPEEFDCKEKNSDLSDLVLEFDEGDDYNDD